MYSHAKKNGKSNIQIKQMGEFFQVINGIVSKSHTFVTNNCRISFDFVKSPEFKTSAFN